MLEIMCKNERQLFCFDIIEGSKMGQSNILDDKNKYHDLSFVKAGSITRNKNVSDFCVGP